MLVSLSEPFGSRKWIEVGRLKYVVPIRAVLALG